MTTLLQVIPVVFRLQMRQRARAQFVAISMIWTGISIAAFGQGNKAASPAPGPGASAPLSGLSYTVPDLPTEPPGDPHVTLCLDLKSVEGAAQPFVLVFRTNDATCSFDAKQKRPLRAGDKLVIKIHARSADMDTFALLNVNIATAQGTSINPAPLRPTLSTSAVSAVLGFNATRPEELDYYLVWPIPLQGDTILTMTVNGVYTPMLEWRQSTLYPQGSLVVAGNHMYAALQSGRSAATKPAFPVVANARGSDGSVIWQESGTIDLLQWAANKSYALGDVIVVPNGHAYTVVKPGSSGATVPVFPIAGPTNVGTVTDGGVIWQDTGSIPAASPVSLSQVVIPLWSFTLPQVHPKYYFNLATGVVASFVRNPSFYRTPLPPSPDAPSAPAQYQTAKDHGDIGVAPVLMFTTYLKPMDAESPWTWTDLVPGASFGFSLTSPSSSFYFGGTSEIRRNLQVVYGLNLAKVNALAPAGFVAPTSSTAPATKTEFGKGGFVGLTVNFDFIKGLFSPGK